ncbi:MAG: 16S rRNA (guanine(966)-N(2))-methyltransferase RsmD [Bdellovibrionota bacterium]
MRIISGKLKGRRLKSFKADHIRPTTDRVKETLFNILMSDVPDARVLDLFSGTGNLAIEAWSRGAKYVEAVELNKKSIFIIRDNLKELGIEKEIKIVASDVFKYVKSYKGEPFDLVFVDPPFTEKIAHSSMEAIALSRVCRPGGVVIIESSAQERIDDEYKSFKLLDRREFGDKSASIFRND